MTMEALGRSLRPGSSATLLEWSTNRPILTRARAMPGGLSEIPDHKSASRKEWEIGGRGGLERIENVGPLVGSNYQLPRPRERG